MGKVAVGQVGLGAVQGLAVHRLIVPNVGCSGMIAV